MAKKHLSEDEIKYVITAETDRAQKEIASLSKATNKLKLEERDRRKAMIELEVQGKKNTDEYENLSKELKEYSKQIGDNNKKMDEMRKKLDVNAMTMAQLRKQSKNLRAELDNTSKALNPAEYAELEKQIQKVGKRMNELSINVKSLSEIANSEATLSTMFGMLYTKAGEAVANWVSSLKDFAAEGVEMAASADGITRAFKRLDDGSMLNNLRQATKGTVTDLELMKASVQAKDFRIPLEDLGKYLQFAQLKAQQTGQSVDYLTDSIITGLGRKSTMILDNLGLSSTEINEELAKTGDFMAAVASIVDKQLVSAGSNYVSAADRMQQRTVELKNAQMALGEELLPLKEKWDDTYGEMQVSSMELIGWMVKHRGILLTLTTAVSTYLLVKKAQVLLTRLSTAETTKETIIDKVAIVLKTNGTRAALLYAAAKAKLAGNTTRAAAAMKMFNSNTSVSPWGIVISLAAAATVAFFAFRKRTDEVSQSVKSLNKIQSKVSEEMGNEISKIKTLTDVMRNSNVGYGERQKALEELNSKVPGYNASLTQEGKLINDNTTAINDYLVALEKKIKLTAAQEELEELYRKQRSTKKELSGFEENKKVAQDIPVTSTGQSGALATMGKSAEVKAYQNQIDNTTEKLNEIEIAIKAVNNEIVTTSQATTAATATQVDLIEAKKKEIEEAERVIASTPKDLDAKHKKIDLLQSELQVLQNIGRQTKSNKEKSEANKEESKILATERDVIKSLEALREEDLQNLQQFYNAQQAVFKTQLSEKKLSQEQYDMIMIGLEKQNAESIFQVERTYYEDAQSLNFQNGEIKEEQVRKANQRIIDAEKKANETRLAEQQMMNGLVKGFKDQFKLSSIEEDLQAQLSVLYDSFRARVEIIDNQLAAQKISQEEANAALMELDAAYFRAKEQLTTDSENQILQLRAKYGLDVRQMQYEIELEQLKKHLEDKLLTEEEFEIARGNLEKERDENRKNSLAISAEDIKKALEGDLESMEKVFNYYSGLLLSAVDSLKQAEMSNIDAKYDAEIEAAQGNAEEVERLEKEKAQKKLNVEKKYADVNFAIKASQIVVSTGMAIMQALGQLGPIAGPIAAALMGVAGAAQLATANAERQKVKNMTISGSSGGSGGGARVATGREDGGKIDVVRSQDGKFFPKADYDPDARGFIDKPTVIVGEGPAGRSKEWVASNAAVENPTIAPILSLLDKAQQAGTIRTLDLNQAIRGRGFASGGSITPQTTLIPQPVNSDLGSTLPPVMMEKLARAIINIDENGVAAAVALTEIDQKRMLRDRTRSIGSKS